MKSTDKTPQDNQEFFTLFTKFKSTHAAASYLKDLISELPPEKQSDFKHALLSILSTYEHPDTAFHLLRSLAVSVGGGVLKRYAEPRKPAFKDINF